MARWAARAPLRARQSAIATLARFARVDLDDLERAVAHLEQAAIQASCETRRLWGQQAQAFAAAALPLCRDV